MKKMFITLILMTTMMMSLIGCGATSSTEEMYPRPVISFDAGTILADAQNHQIKMLMLSSVPMDNVDVTGAVEELEGFKAKNDAYLDELNELKHKEATSEEYKMLLIEYLQEENAYIDKTIEAVYAKEISRPSRFSLETLYARANEKIARFRYEPK
ncbi:MULTISPECIES: hypothetical protein [unclassified Exiguobacterium]|uniref:hypothetical protein n=1 Tax=unclassified Exiguobacterium TaxID=2644629 RepID=UPI001BE6388F|nr:MULTISPECIES: hypothetical protein [unclassified Exiguobacterium]